MTTKAKRKARKYEENYKDIPIEHTERLEWMFDKYNLSDNKCAEILSKRDIAMSSLEYTDINIVLFEEPEGTQRHRYRIINRKNFASASISNPSFVHVYSPNAQDDHNRMKRLTETELSYLDNMICTPCVIQYKTYHKTPKTYNITDQFLSEIGLIRPITKPDWDNLGKKYSDMSNANLWLDDSFVIDGTVSKYYSILPRVEISIRYLNMVYNKYQYNAVTNRKDYKEEYNLKYFGGKRND